jgi:hypothetical protein
MRPARADTSCQRHRRPAFFWSGKERKLAKLLRTLVSTLAAAFLIASFAQGQVRQGTEPESVRHDQSESEYGAQRLIGTWETALGTRLR